MKNLITRILFVSIVLLIISAYFYRDTITSFPRCIHAWTQSDHLAISYGFIDNGFDFFHPQTLNLQTKGGITSIDFPIHDYVISLLMNILHLKEPVVFRVYILLYGIMGMLFLFFLSKKLTSSSTKSAFVVLFAFTAPVYTYYQAGFLPTIPSLANAFAGYFFFFRYSERFNMRDFYAAVFFLTLAALCRTTFSIFLVAICCHNLLAFIQKKKINYSILSGYLVSFGIIAGYYLYNLHLRKEYGSIFLGHFLPADNLSDLGIIVNRTAQNWADQYFTWVHYIALSICVFLLICAVFYKKTKFFHINLRRDVGLQLAIMLLGAVSAFLLLAKQFMAHDYYFLDTFFLVITLFFAYTVKLIPDSWILNIILVFFSFLMIAECKEIQTKRYTTGHWDRCEIARINYTGSDQFLESLNIPESAKMLVFDSYPYSIPLMLMRRKGYVVTMGREIQEALLLDFDFIAIQDMFLVSDVIQNYPDIINKIEKIGSNNGISIYRTRQRTAKTDLHSFLNISGENIICRADLHFDKDSLYNYWYNTGCVTTAYFQSSPYSAVMNDTIEFSATLAISAAELVSDKSAHLLFEGSILAPGDLSNAALVVSVSSGSKTGYYVSFDMDQYVLKSDDWQRIRFLFTLPQMDKGDGMLKLYFWNPVGRTFYYDDISLIIFNP